MQPYEPYYYEFAKQESSWASFPRREVVVYLKSRYRPGMRIFEVGCGTGEVLRFLPRDIFYVGIERSAWAVEDARLKWGASHPNAKFLVGDSAALPSEDAQFDIVLMLYTIEHVRLPQKSLLECKRILRHNGALVILAPNLEFPLAWPNALRHRSGFYRIWFVMLRSLDYLKRLFGMYSFRVISENFSEHTGRYEKKDDDLRHVVSSWEAIRFLEKNGFRSAVFWEERPLSGWRRMIRFLPTLHWYGVPLAGVFEKIR